jgi:hypothetical protein
MGIAVMNPFQYTDFTENTEKERTLRFFRAFRVVRVQESLPDSSSFSVSPQSSTARTRQSPKNKNCPARWRRAVRVFNFQLSLCHFDDHIFKQYLERHGVAASFVGHEKFAVAVKNTAIVRNVVLTIVTVKIKVKLIEVESVSILSVTFCFFDLTYQSRIHCISLLF